MMTRGDTGLGKLKSKPSFTVALFKVRKTGKYIIELGTGGGLEKRSDDVRELVQLIGCGDRNHAKQVIKDLKRMYKVK